MQLVVLIAQAKSLPVRHLGETVGKRRLAGVVTVLAQPNSNPRARAYKTSRAPSTAPTCFSKKVRECQRILLRYANFHKISKIMYQLKLNLRVIDYVMKHSCLCRFVILLLRGCQAILRSTSAWNNPTRSLAGEAVSHPRRRCHPLQ